MPRPIKGKAFSVGVSLYKNDGTLVANPGTVTAKISKDFGDWADVETVTEEDSVYSQLKLALTATEFNADVVDLYVTDDTPGTVPWRATIYTEPEAATAAALATVDDLVDDLESRLTAARAGYLDALNTGVTLAATQAAYAPAKAGDAMTLTAAYDAAKTAASQASVNAIPTTPLLDEDYTAPDNAGIAAILEDTGTTLPASIAALPTTSDLLAAALALGSGANSFEYTVTSDGSPLYQAEVIVSSDAAGDTLVARGLTNSLGKITFMLNSGTHYFWVYKSGYAFDNPDTEVVG